MSIQKMILWRVFEAFFVLWAISLIMFVLIETMPGDFASATAPRFTPPDQVAAFRERMGLNVAPVLRYFVWIGNAFQGDLGTSWSVWVRDPDGSYEVQVFDHLVDRIGNTLILTGLAGAKAFPIGFLAAIVPVRFPGSFFDWGSSATSLGLISIPEFVSAMLLTAIFVVQIPVFPAHVAFHADMG